MKKKCKCKNQDKSWIIFGHTTKDGYINCHCSECGKLLFRTKDKKNKNKKDK